ncbi:MAG: threonine dehydratase [Propionibacteriaceae bacterium]|nr:threonine dehydratase [Propionibacteriaceae bacterium]
MPEMSTFLTFETLARAQQIVAVSVPESPAFRWPLIEQATGTTTWIKHENHNPTGAFKVRGGLTYMSHLVESGATGGVISASRGNHSQSLAFAGARFSVPVTIVVPEGNSADKNAATLGWGAKLVIHGRDFQEAVEYARTLAEAEGLSVVPSVHPWLVEGVATYAAELHNQVPDLDVIYVPVGMGSGICANIAVRDLIGARTAIVGVVAERAPAYALSFDAKAPVLTDCANTFVDGVACRTPDPWAVDIIARGASRIVQVTEHQAASAMTLMYRATHNLAEPAGALALAAALVEKEQNKGLRVGLIMTGGNADYDVLQRVFTA